MRLTSIAAITILALSANAQTPKPKTATAPVQKAPAKAATPAPKATTPAPKTTQVAKPTTAKTVATKTTVAPAKPMPAAKPAAVPAKPAAAAKTAPAKTTAKPVSKPAPIVAKKTPAAPAEPPSPAKKEAAPEIARTGRRDPFISPVRLAEERMKNNPACTTGARCLVINQLVLKGVVKTQNGMIAMVENAAKKEYNLHEKDTVQNGSVLRITTDSIVFQESTTDPLGRAVTKEVVKRVTVPAV